MSIFIEPSQRRPQHPGAPLHRARPQGAGGSHGRGFSKGAKLVGFQTMHNVLFGQYVFLPTEQAETYLKIYVLIYH